MPNDDNASEPAYNKLVAIPKDINKGLSAAKHETMIKFLGAPGELSKDCTPVTNPELKKRMVKKNVGPFSVAGLKPAVEALGRIFAKVKKERPGLFKLLESDGMVCVRRVRRSKPPPSKNFSNHSWGTAIDLKIRGASDSVGDVKALFGLVKLCPFFNDERFFWGAGFKPADQFEDSMHFEASEELIIDWKKNEVI